MFGGNEWQDVILGYVFGNPIWVFYFFGSFPKIGVFPYFRETNVTRPI